MPKDDDEKQYLNLIYRHSLSQRFNSDPKICNMNGIPITNRPMWEVQQYRLF